MLGVMPYTFLIDNKDNVIRETWTGTFDLEQLKESCFAEWAHPDYRRGLAMLCDFRLARGKLSVDDVLKFASWFSNDDAPPRLAIVVRRERAFDFAGMFSMIRESDTPKDCRTRLFFSYVEANAWVTLNRSLAAPQRQEGRASARIAASEG
jgi:hypothetical protein